MSLRAGVTVTRSKKQTNLVLRLSAPLDQSSLEKYQTTYIFKIKMKILTSPALSIKICRKFVQNLRYEWVLEKEKNWISAKK